MKNIFNKEYAQYLILKFIPEFIIKIILPSWIEVSQFVKTLVRDIAPHSTVLDAGAGECQYKDLFSEHRYFSIDAGIGEQAWNYSNLDIIGDLTKMPIKNEGFDVIISTQVLEHLNEPQLFINEAFRILKPGGVIFLSAPQGWGVHQAPHDYFRFTSHGLQYLLQKAGFTIEYIKPSSGYFGYLSNRISMLPRYLFWQIKNPFFRVLFLPLEFVSYIIFTISLPIILNLLDFLDKERAYTLNYFVKGVKPADIT